MELKRIMKIDVTAGLVAVFLGLAGCQSPPPVLSRGVVHNRTEKIIQDVSVTHHPTGKSASVSAILPGQTLDIGFGARPLLADSAMVRWREGAAVRERKLQIPVPKEIEESTELVLVYEIRPAARVRVYFLGTD